MKNLTILLLSSLLFLFFACNEHKDTGHKWNPKTESYYNFNDFVDTKAVLKIDTVAFRKMMDRYLSPKRIIDLFGAGYNLFYAVVIIHPDGSVGFGLTPDASATVGGGDNSKFYLYKENVEIESDFAIVPQQNQDDKAIRISNIFFEKRYDYRKIFNATAGYLNGKQVITLVLLQLDITVNNTMKIVNPWTIKQVDFTTYSTKLKSKQSAHLYNGFFPAIMNDDYKTLKDKVVFPQEAIKRGVNGKVLVKLFFEENGTYAGYQLIKGLGYGCEEAVIKAIEDYPLSSYPSGERTTLILPFSFGNSSLTEVDFAVKSIEVRYPEAYNNLYVEWSNNLSLTKPITTQYKVVVNINGETINASLIRAREKKQALWFRWKPAKPGTYDYVVSIDPENVLNDVDRSNNIVRGKLVIK
ncbi:MAG: hypothetical protein FD122_1547 [Stygiobacter sp.]|nr:MAG: hypothetical protein FD122_1547 [Stygiobacter sp.]KAF0214381.1 MAG: hypothetical protein FD178_2457 [Ignavibacteria bacterium]